LFTKKKSHRHAPFIVRNLRSNAVHNTSFPDVVKVLRDKSGKSPLLPLTINAADVVTRSVPWLIDNFLVRGALNGFQGIKGEGKSWLTASLVGAVADGGKWYGDSGNLIPVTQGRVLLANFDDDVSYTMVCV
jgi:RecA-family ATPase